MATILSIDNLVVRYGAIEALHGVSLRVDSRQIVCLIGANGAGKSSLLRCISGLVPAADGSIIYSTDVLRDGTIIRGWRQEPLHRWPAHAIVRAGISHVPEG